MERPALPLPPTISFSFILLLSLSAAAAATLDRRQLKALKTLGLSTSKDPCSNPPALQCDTSTPFNHLISLNLTHCSHPLHFSSTTLNSLSTLQYLHLANCPTPLPHFPNPLSSSLTSFTSIHSFNMLTGVWLSRLTNLTTLTVSDSPIKASGPSVILSHLTNLHSLTITNTTLSGSLPNSWHTTITHIDLSLNHLKGEIPSSIGDLINLRTLSFASNSLSGPIPESLAAVPLLQHLDLSSNQLNGTIPGFLAHVKGLRHLNLEKNNFHGVMPFNVSFIKRLQVFKIGENTNLCHNHSSASSMMKLGIAPCDKYGLPVSPPAQSPDTGGNESDYSDSSADETSQKGNSHHSPDTVVLGVVIAIVSLIFLIIFLILLAKWCA